MDKPLITAEDINKLLNSLYEQSKKGMTNAIPPVDKMADDYLKKYPTKEKAAKAMLNVQIAKCTTSGFVTGFGGLITMPLTVPANISSVLFVQMRMIACTAYMAGYNLDDDQVQTFVYACLAGISVNQIVKKFGVEFGKKLALQGVKKIPGKVLTKINQRVGFRLLTKFGEKGLINLGKTLPVVGAAVGGGFDFVETKIIANRAYKMFIKNDFSAGDKDSNDDFIDTDFED